MVTVSGTATSRGFVSGTVFLYAGDHDVVLPEYTLPESKIGAELARYREARAETRRQLEGVVAFLHVAQHAVIYHFDHDSVLVFSHVKYGSIVCFNNNDLTGHCLVVKVLLLQTIHITLGLLFHRHFSSMRQRMISYHIFFCLSTLFFKRF